MIRALVALGTVALTVAGKATYTIRDAPVEGGLCDPTVKSTSGTPCTSCQNRQFVITLLLSIHVQVMWISTTMAPLRAISIGSSSLARRLRLTPSLCGSREDQVSPQNYR
jgi:hypothetical protein